MKCGASARSSHLLIPFGDGDSRAETAASRKAIRAKKSAMRERVAVDDPREYIGEIAERLNAIDLAGLCRPSNYAERAATAQPRADVKSAPKIHLVRGCVSPAHKAHK